MFAIRKLNNFLINIFRKDFQGNFVHLQVRFSFWLNGKCPRFGFCSQGKRSGVLGPVYMEVGDPR